MLTIRSKAPLRIGLAGGGTDVSPYSDLYGGNILNITINQYAYATIIPRNNGQILMSSQDLGEFVLLESDKAVIIDGRLNLLKGVYNRIVKQFNLEKLSFELHTYVDAPAGSGLGTSSTLVVAILGAFCEWLKLPLGEYDIAHLAFEIERIDLKMSGGKQDQYSATFGGVNFMEFYKDDKVIVNPLRVKSNYLSELQFSSILYYTGVSRISAQIIDSQISNVNNKELKSTEAMHSLKKQALMMKEAVLKGELSQVGELLDYGWQEKKKMAKEISNSDIDILYEAVLKAGASGGKISGAGGGGFMYIYCPEVARYSVIKVLNQFKGEIKPFQFVEEGLTTWSVDY
jgi:D-glycero-alpha-D-manno-heptose-7-phosphate kinase